jgi:uncharacterized membrane protein
VKKLQHFLKKNFITGLLVVVPVGVTIFVLKALLIWIDSILGDVEQELLGQYYPGLGIFTLLLLILFIGIISANYIGNKVFQAWDRLLRRLPLVRGIYSTVRQMMEAFSADQNFSGVGLVEYPRKGCYSVGFITGQADENAMGLPGKHLSVFVPTTPNPTAGFLLILPENEVRKLDMTVDKGMKYIVSLGMASMNEQHAKQLLQKTAGEDVAS